MQKIAKKKKYPSVKAVQLVHETRHDKQVGDIEIARAGHWLSKLSA